MLKIYGSSDDLIELEGDVYEEFPASGYDEYNYVATSNGYLVRIHFDNEGFWKIMVLRKSDEYTLDPADDEETNHSDVLTIPGRVDWVVVGSQWAKA